MCVYYMYYCFHAILQIGSFPCYVCQRAFFHHVPPVWLWGPKRILWSRLSALQMRTSWVWIEIESRTQENLMIVSVRMKTKYSNSLLSVLGLANSDPDPYRSIAWPWDWQKLTEIASCSGTKSAAQELWSFDRDTCAMMGLHHLATIHTEYTFIYRIYITYTLINTVYKHK